MTFTQDWLVKKVSQIVCYKGYGRRPSKNAAFGAAKTASDSSRDSGKEVKRTRNGRHEVQADECSVMSAANDAERVAQATTGIDAGTMVNAP